MNKQRREELKAICDAATEAYDLGFNSRDWQAWRATMRNEAYNALCVALPEALAHIEVLERAFEIAIDDARKVLLRANLPCVPKTSTIIEHSIDRAGKELEDG
jgi:hypothetical protein